MEERRLPQELDICSRVHQSLGVQGRRNWKGEQNGEARTQVLLPPKESVWEVRNRDRVAMNMPAVGLTRGKRIQMRRNIPGPNYCTATTSEANGALVLGNHIEI